MKGPKKLFLFMVMGALVFTGCQPRKANKQQESRQENAPANMIPDIKMSHIGGSQVSIKDEVAKSKLTILDFWASWCGPCVSEAPSIVALYHDYHAKGLGIVGISLDQDESAWKDAVERLGMNWTHLSDLQGWNNAAAQLFGVTSIPYTVVVDQKGTILAQGLRGDALRQFVSEKLD